MRLRRLLAPLLILATALACGGGGGGSRSWGGLPSGALTVQFGSDSFPGYDRVVVSVEKLEGTTDGVTWTALGSVQATYDLMQLQNGHSQTLLTSPSVPAGTYTQLRLTWATTNYQSAINLPAYAVPTGGSGQPMAMPATTVVAGPVTVPVGGSASIQIMLSGQQAVQARAGGSAPFTFQATGQAFDTTQVASISGHLSDGTTPLAGVEVFAETLDGTLTVPTLQRRAFTDAAGNYLLEALPATSHTAYYVVAQPGNATTAYGAVAADPVIVTSPAAYTADLAFRNPTAPGSLTLSITPASTTSQGTWGELRQTIATGTSGYATLVVCSQTATTGAAQDQVYFAGLAPSTYGVTAQRSTSGGAPVAAVGTNVVVSAGSTATTTISY